ncbi:hypothetical protein FGO68_gene13375 [Halteria grandinella]|uniref:Protein kinase domain-containing protein n=1 Tax=Halteria grandinella TaxID=5974 RepID=A0A8J8SXT5_HALGN|nr:hypothetical protein FGO68_gene13375 [Halteria grandinella]
MHALSIQPNLVKVYEDNTKFYLICQNMKLQSLETLLLNGFEFKEVPLVSIIFIIFQTLQKYKAKGLYHGNISLQSVFINISSPVLQTVVLFPKYLAASDYTIDNDLYNVGVMLYKITFHNQKTKYTQYVDLNLIDHKKQQMHDANYKETQYKFLYRISQLDLLTQLLLPGASLEQVLRHQWFVTIKQNLKMDQTKPVHRQSLNTIVESVNELSMTSSQDRMYYIPQQQNDYGNNCFNTQKQKKNFQKNVKFIIHFLWYHPKLSMTQSNNSLKNQKHFQILKSKGKKQFQSQNNPPFYEKKLYMIKMFDQITIHNIIKLLVLY